MSSEQDLTARIRRGVEALARLIVAAAIVTTLALFGFWEWAGLLLGLFILGEVVTVGMFVRRLVEERDYEIRARGDHP